MADEARTYEIEVFRVGPSSRGITAKELDEAVTSYDADKAPAPLVFGHPESDKPAHGWVAALRREGDRLLATLKDVSAEAIEKVKAKAFRNRSIAFWHPTHSANPAAGKWGVRHLGLLGAAQPGIPNMTPLRFSADESAIEADEAPEAALVFAEEKGTQTITIEQGGNKVPDPNKGETVAKTEFDALKAEHEAAVAERDRLKTAADAVAAQAENNRKAGNVQFVEDRVKEGRLLPGHKDLFVELLNRLPTEEVQFNAETKGTLEAELKKVLTAAQPQIIFEALSPRGDGIADKTTDAQSIVAKANKMVADAKAGGRVLSFEAAVEAIEKKGSN